MNLISAPHPSLQQIETFAVSAVVCISTVVSACYFLIAKFKGHQNPNSTRRDVTVEFRLSIGQSPRIKEQDTRPRLALANDAGKDNRETPN